MKIYKHRGYLILKNKETNKWYAVSNFHDFNNEFDSIEKTKNAIDGRLGGYPTRRIPKRWLKDEKLAKEYNS